MTIPTWKLTLTRHDSNGVEVESVTVRKDSLGVALGLAMLAALGWDDSATPLQVLEDIIGTVTWPQASGVSQDEQLSILHEVLGNVNEGDVWTPAALLAAMGRVAAGEKKP